MSTGAMFGAAVYSHIGAANLLLGALPDLPQVEWRLVAKGAVERDQNSFLQWMLDKGILDLSPSEAFDVIGEAPVWGSIDTLKLLASRRLLSNRPTWALDFRHHGLEVSNKPPARYGVEFRRQFESPLLAAMSWSRTDIVSFFLEQKWPQIEDLSSTFVGHLWEQAGFQAGLSGRSFLTTVTGHGSRQFCIDNHATSFKAGDFSSDNHQGCLHM
jgi:hypothetical protein